MDNTHRWRVTQLLPIAAKAFPKLRVGQIIDNAIVHAYDGDRAAQDLFSIPDHELADALKEYIRDHKTEGHTI